MDMDRARGVKGAATVLAGAVLLVGAAYCCVSLLLAAFSLAQARNWLSVPGDILYAVYGFSSFLVPAFILWSSILLLVPGWTVRSGILLGGSVVPFLTIAGGEKLVRTVALTILNASVSLTVTLGIVASTVLALAVEYLLLLYLSDRVMRRIRYAHTVSVPFETTSIETASIETAPVETETEPVETATESAGPGACVIPANTDLHPSSAFEEAFLFPAEPVQQAETVPEPVPAVAVREETPVPEKKPVAMSESTGTMPVRAVEVPTYVDFEKMRAPFDLPVIEDWVEPRAAAFAPPDAPSAGPGDGGREWCRGCPIPRRTSR